MAAKTKLAEPTLMTVAAGDAVHAVAVIYPDGRSKGRCGAVAVAEERRLQAAVSAVTCPACRAWAEGTD